MKHLGPGTAIGIAHSEYLDRLMSGDFPFDYVEVPFEHLVANPEVAQLADRVPLILHCASLSLAGDDPPDPALIDKLKHFINATGTPWLGEHIAYVRADGKWKDQAEHVALTHLSRPEAETGNEVAVAPFNIGYTVSPQLSDPILHRITAAAQRWEQELGVPLLLENGPMYFQMPGSTMTQLEFIQGLCSRRKVPFLLLDLTHLAITCSNFDLDPVATLCQLPLTQVTEVHISGAKEEEGLLWDDHSRAAPEVVFRLLEELLRRKRPRAITFEYNWSSDFSFTSLQNEVSRVRALLN